MFTMGNVSHDSSNNWVGYQKMIGSMLLVVSLLLCVFYQKVLIRLNLDFLVHKKIFMVFPNIYICIHIWVYWCHMVTFQNKAYQTLSYLKLSKNNTFIDFFVYFANFFTYYIFSHHFGFTKQGIYCYKTEKWFHFWRKCF